MALAPSLCAKPSKAALVLERLMQAHPPGFDLGLDRIAKLLALLGDPHKRLPPTIHVAGTNGKGSTIALMRAIAMANGKKVHVHTSPHLVDWHERFIIANEQVSDTALVAALEEIEDLLNTPNGVQGITVFEILTATAFVLFANNSADLLLLETGLGGEFDATNVIEEPAVSVITPIDYDHQSFLGDSLAKIAKAKAGIIKNARPVIIGIQNDEAFDVLEAKALSLGCEFLRQDQDFQGYMQHGRFVYQDDDGLQDLPLPALVGEHQIQNGALAIAALKAAEKASSIKLDEAIIAQGLKSAVWPGRMQKLPKGKLSHITHEQNEIWLDGGHNPHAAKVVSATIGDMLNDRSLTLIIGMLNTKDAKSFLQNYARFKADIIGVPLQSTSSGISPEELANDAAQTGLNARIAPDLSAALKLANSEDDPRLILICGSLYLVGDALALNGTPPQ